VSEAERRRTVRRGVAVVSLALSLLLLQVPVVTDALPGVVESPLPGVARVAGGVLLVAAALYLAGSVGRQIARAADTLF